jgi:hypothetical protein
LQVFGVHTLRNGNPRFSEVSRFTNVQVTHDKCVLLFPKNTPLWTKPKMILLNYVRNRVPHVAIIRSKFECSGVNFRQGIKSEFRIPKGYRVIFRLPVVFNAPMKTRGPELELKAFRISIFEFRIFINSPTASASFSPSLLIFPRTNLRACYPLLWGNRTASVARENG